LYNRLRPLRIIYSEDPWVNYFIVFSLVPPLLLSAVYCLLATMVESILVGCAPVPAPAPAPAPAPPADPRHTNDDFEVARAPRQRPRCCERGIPLAWSGMIIMGLQLIELVTPLIFLRRKTGDAKLFVAGLVLKVMFWNIITIITEVILSAAKCCRHPDPARYLPIRLFVYGNRIVRDIFVSAFIFLTLMPWVLLNAMTDLCLPRFSCHHMLIYRTPGTVSRTKIGDSSSDEEAAAGSAVA